MWVYDVTLSFEFIAIEEGGEAWKYSLRVGLCALDLSNYYRVVTLIFTSTQPCTECLFLSLFHEYQAALTPLLLNMLNESMELIPPNDMSRIVKKDALYNAIGLAAFELFDEVDFDGWFSQVFDLEINFECCMAA